MMNSSKKSSSHGISCLSNKRKHQKPCEKTISHDTAGLISWAQMAWTGLESTHVSIWALGCLSNFWSCWGLAISFRSHVNFDAVCGQMCFTRRVIYTSWSGQGMHGASSCSSCMRTRSHGMESWVCTDSWSFSSHISWQVGICASMLINPFANPFDISNRSFKTLISKQGENFLLQRVAVIQIWEKELHCVA